MSKPLIVITGASSGIGAATAQVFAAAGHPLLLLARRLEPMLELQLPNALCCAVDIRDAEAMNRALEAAGAQYGPVDCLVNNAGVMLNAPFIEGDPQQWSEMIDINLKGALNGMRIVARDMANRQSGSIINIGSIAGRKTFDNHAVYCGTKFALHAITETVRQELAGSKVRLITIAPGMVETELVNHTTHEASREGWRSYAGQIGGALSAQSIAQAILWSYQMPQSVCVREMVICPTGQEP
jgi:NADP-dependent 3-hydroxy acid dehydrogenase YdfG